MKKDLQPVPTDIYQLAEDARRTMAKNSRPPDDDTSTHESLATGLEQVRGVAIQRARAANVRLRKQAVGVTALGFGMGVAMGLLICRLRRFTDR